MRELSKPRPLPGSRRGRGLTFGTAPSTILLSFSLFSSFSAFFGGGISVLSCFVFPKKKPADGNSADFYKYFICVPICQSALFLSPIQLPGDKYTDLFLSSPVCIFV